MAEHDTPCRTAIESKIKIENIEGDQVEMKNSIQKMADTANKIYIAVLASLLSVLGNMIMFWIARAH